MKEIRTNTSPYATDFKGLMYLFGCGRGTAEIYARESGAEFRVGGKRYYFVPKVLDYINGLIEAQQGVEKNG